jgi:hypothetical protein
LRWLLPHQGTRGQFGNVSLNTSDVAADRLYGRVEFFLTAARDEDVGTLFYESFAAANPIPVVPPVMTATFPCNFLFSVMECSHPHSHSLLLLDW